MADPFLQPLYDRVQIREMIDIVWTGDASGMFLIDSSTNGCDAAVFAVTVLGKALSKVYGEIDQKKFFDFLLTSPRSFVIITFAVR